MEDSNRPSSKFKKERQPYWKLEHECESMRETIEFVSDKCDRQGQLIAGVVDYIFNNIENEELDTKTLIEVVYHEMSNHIVQEAEIMAHRVNKLRQSNHGN